MPTDALTLQLLAWVADRPRRYGETMEAWRTTCPRLTIWEDAVSAGLVAVKSGAAMQDARVIVTARGRDLLAQRLAPSRPPGLPLQPGSDTPAAATQPVAASSPK